MAFVKVGSLTKLPRGSMMEVAAGGRYYAICNTEDGVHALDGVCPHHGGPLGQGALNGFAVTCPWHAWEFDCRTGAFDVLGLFFVRAVRHVDAHAVRAGGDQFLDHLRITRSRPERD